MEQARPMMRKVMEATRAEDGCIEYNYAEDVLDPGLIRVSEVWKAASSSPRHLKTAAYGRMGRGTRRAWVSPAGRSRCSRVSGEDAL